MIVPVGRLSQRLLLITRQPGKLDIQRRLSVRFVPMVHP
jgi:protein-L-isoaspartate O-methyltransferase